jgi:hypothetical protein
MYFHTAAKVKLTLLPDSSYTSSVNSLPSLLFPFLSPIFVDSYKFTRIRDGASGGVAVTYFKCTEPHCGVTCRTLLFSLDNPPEGGITFIKVRQFIPYIQVACHYIAPLRVDNYFLFI